MAASPVSGTQWEITHGAQHVTLVEVGGGLREYTVGGEPVLDGYATGEMCTGARGQTLAPWPNRLKDGRYAFDDEELQTAISEPSKGTAIHGLVRWRSWTCVEHTDDRVAVEQLLLPQHGYPFTLHLRNEYTLSAAGLTVRTTATNRGTGPLPYALGFHPYLTVGMTTIDRALAHIPGATVLPVDDRGIPTGRSSVEATEYDFRTPRPLGDTEIDITFTDLERDEAGHATVTLRHPDDARSVSLWVDETFPYVEIFTGDTLPEQDKRRTGLGCEPMTGPPNALQSGEDCRTLSPGEAMVTTWGIRVTGYPGQEQD